MTDTITDPEAIVLEGELEELQVAITATERRIADLAEQLIDAQVAEGEAMDALESAKAAAGPLLMATRQSEGQAAVFVGDTIWRQQHGAAADAYDRMRTAQGTLVKASSATNALAKERERQARSVLPALRGAVDAKQHELEQHQQTQAAAIAKAKTWRDRVRGKS